MIKRPMLWIFAVLVFISCIYNYCFGDKDDVKHYIMDKAFEDKADVKVVGTAVRYEIKTNSCAIYLKDSNVYLDKKYFFSDIIIYISEKPSYIQGSKVLISGIIYKFDTPSNPGQFNLKQYYKEKNIYYSVYAESFEVLYTPKGIFYKLKAYLEEFKQTLINVYERALPQKEFGIISTMILGDKSFLDMDIRNLYQENGIGHLLAISGLHVTILGMAVYKFFEAVQLPEKISAGVAVVFLYAYGYMTGFGISTLRAVIMIMVMLMAQVVRRSYDMLSAAGFSAIIIMLLKPYAIYSCSFLLSYGAILGIAVILPTIKNMFCYEDSLNMHNLDNGMKNNSNSKDSELKGNILKANKLKGRRYIKEFARYKRKLDKRFFSSISNFLDNMDVKSSNVIDGLHPYCKRVISELIKTQKHCLLLFLIYVFFYSDGYNSCIYILKLYFTYYNKSFLRKYLRYILYFIWEKIKEIFLVSLSIQLSILPVILYFYYEFPIYSIFINIIILPLASLLVLLAAIGGLIGIIFFPAGSFILGGTYVILNFYEYVCTAASKLPYHILITGKPKLWQIVLYYLLVALVVLIVNLMFCKQVFFEDCLRWLSCRDHKNTKFIIKNTKSVIKNNFLLISRAILVLTLVFSFFVLIYTPKETGLTMTFLDVGQGDCIFIRNNCGTVYLIDGGSSSVDYVGKYRIIPYLKCNGIDEIDHMIMTHADSDHISGLLEILEQSDDGIKVKNLLVPNPSNECKDESYYKIIELAYNNGVRVCYIERGNIIKEGDFSMLCLHPMAGFSTNSANAYSTVLSIKFGKTSYLLTGDIESDGESALIDILTEANLNKDIINENVKEISNENSNNIFAEIPNKYDILKVAHHGSKNSTPDDFLEKVSPTLSIISCGKNNIYRHPHKELLERLERAGSKYVSTKDEGAVILYSDGERIMRKSIYN